jgi:hypothetical protein
MMRSRWMGLLLACVLSLVSAGVLVAAPGWGQARVTVVARGLDNPLGLR